MIRSWEHLYWYFNLGLVADINILKITIEHFIRNISRVGDSAISQLDLVLCPKARYKEGAGWNLSKLANITAICISCLEAMEELIRIAFLLAKKSYPSLSSPVEPSRPLI